MQQFDLNGYGILFSYFLWPFLNVSFTVSIFMTVAIALERFYALRYQDDYTKNNDPKRVIKLVSRVVAPALVLNASKFFEFRPQGGDIQGD